MSAAAMEGMARRAEGRLMPTEKDFAAEAAVSCYPRVACLKKSKSWWLDPRSFFSLSFSHPSGGGELEDATLVNEAKS
jgi:hypothetical protein